MKISAVNLLSSPAVKIASGFNNTQNYPKTALQQDVFQRSNTAKISFGSTAENDEFFIVKKDLLDKNREIYGYEETYRDKKTKRVAKTVSSMRGNYEEKRYNKYGKIASSLERFSGGAERETYFDDKGNISCESTKGEIKLDYFGRRRAYRKQIVSRGRGVNQKITNSHIYTLDRKTLVSQENIITQKFKGSKEYLPVESVKNFFKKDGTRNAIQQQWYEYDNYNKLTGIVKKHYDTKGHLQNITNYSVEYDKKGNVTKEHYRKQNVQGATTYSRTDESKYINSWLKGRNVLVEKQVYEYLAEPKRINKYILKYDGWGSTRPEEVYKMQGKDSIKHVELRDCLV